MNFTIITRGTKNKILEKSKHTYLKDAVRAFASIVENEKFEGENLSVYIYQSDKLVGKHDFKKKKMVSHSTRDQTGKTLIRN